MGTNKTLTLAEEGCDLGARFGPRLGRHLNSSNLWACGECKR